MEEEDDHDRAAELLQQLTQGVDPTTELSFLDSLLLEERAAVSSNKSALQASEKKAGPVIENGVAVDVNVCDITITVDSAEDDENLAADDDGVNTEHEEGNRENGVVLSDFTHVEKDRQVDDSKLVHNSTDSTHSQYSPSDPQSNGQITHGLDGQAISALAKSVSSWLQNSPESEDPHGVFDEVLVEKVVRYVFERRYGPVDQHCNDHNGQGIHTDPHLVADLNRRLDTVLKRMMELPVTAELVAGYTSVLCKASGLPTMRKKLLEHVMLWQSRQKAVLDVSTFRHVKSLVVAGLSDVWSAVRKTCSAGVARLFRDWTPQQQEELFTCFLEICIDKEGSWQAKDGAALCVHAVMYNCYTANVKTDEGSLTLPTCVVECVLTTVFSLISHPQLSIRETVTKIMSAYMDHVDTQDMMDLMHQTLTLLTPPMAKAEADMAESFLSVEAYAAEGLLNICTSIVKVLPMRQAVFVWLTHCRPFLAYLAHDASSVRQTTSTLLFHTATNREGSAVLLKLVIDQLTRDWPVDVQALTDCHHFLQEDQLGDSLTWEGKEGRMFVYELLCKHLTDCHWAPVEGEMEGGTVNSNNTTTTTTSQHGASEVEGGWRRVGAYLGKQSLLTQLWLLDSGQRLTSHTGVQVLSDAELQDLQRWLLVHSSSPSDRHDDDGVGVSVDVGVPRCRDLLMRMLHHTAVCLAHPQWELRRIAQQVLPVLCEVVCVYSVDLAMDVWRFMADHCGLLSFLGMVTLHHSLSLSARVVATTDLSTNTVRTITNPIYVDFVDGVRRHMQSYLPLVCGHLHREAYDKMSVVAAETALLALNFFDLHPHIQEELCSGVVSLWTNLFTFAHPKSALTTSLFTPPQHTFSSPYDGFLSCCLVRPESDAQCARQVEKSLVGALHRHLSHFLPQLTPALAAHTMPLIAHNIGLFIDDSDICKSLINSFHTLCQCTKKWLARMASGGGSGDSDRDRDMCLRCVYFTIRELTAVIALKSLDVALVQKVLSCYLLVCESLQPDTHLPLLLEGLAARLSNTGFRVDGDDSGGLDVPLCWNKPQLPPCFGQHSCPHDQDSLDCVSYSEENESDTSLNRSSSSLGLQMYSRTGRRRTLSTTDDVMEIREIAARLSPRGSWGGEKGEGEDEEGQEEEEEDEEEEEEDEESDWDSWSEEEVEEERSALQDHFGDFLQRLTDMYGDAGQMILQEGLAKLGAKEQSLVKDLLN